MKTRIVIAGTGYVGMYTAWRLQKKLRRALKKGEVEIVLVGPDSYMTYQPLLPETAAGSLEPRHVVVNLRQLLDRCTLINGRVTYISSKDHRISFTSAAGEDHTLRYDHLVIALGAITRTLPIPGLVEHGIGIKTVGEAVWVRNHVLEQLDIAAATEDKEIRSRALNFTVVGGGFAGIETIAEMENLTRYTIRSYPNLDRSMVRWVLVEASGRILPEVGPELGKRTVNMLRDKGVELHLETFLNSAEDGHVVLSDGTEYDTGTLIWTAGVKPNPVLANSDLPLHERGHVKAGLTLRVPDTDNVWAAGDCAAVPDLTQPEKICVPNAQHAIRQSATLVHNLVAVMNGKNPKPYKHSYLGSIAGLGLYNGVAQIMGIKLRGFPAWVAHRGYHGMYMPTFGRKFRVFTDWTLALFARRDVVSLGEIHEPRADFTRAAKS
ncbi:MAG: NAD(P)/FAD-dependent oxidoreductase [Corynebacteriales bacterium]|nr:NAD(P)/FAD-dependent oxidoreductase [Mycobacteriales bacterium]